MRSFFPSRSMGLKTGLDGPMVTVLDRSDGRTTMSGSVARVNLRRLALLLALIALSATGPASGGAAVIASPRAPGDVGRPELALEAATGSQPGWKSKIDHLVAGKSIGVSVREAGEFLYRRTDKKRRAPASNEKLLLSMAILDRLDPDVRIETTAKAPNVKPNGVVPGNLWLIGRGDPNLGPGKLGSLAREVKQSGVIKIKGSVMGGISYFAHDWWAPGWKPYFPKDHIPLPSALTYKGNVVGGKHISNPEHRAAGALTRQLRNRGVQVAGKAGAGVPPKGLERVAAVRSPTLIVLLRKMLRPSNNFRAELLGKWLAVERQGPPGTIAGGTAAIAAWAKSLGVGIVAHDSSGLSYSNRVSPRGMVRLLDEVEDLAWGEDLMAALPGPGQGTLQGRLSRVPVKAKTGTLTEISALSGWVYLKATGTWAEFSVISRGMSTSAAKALEDKIVRIIWKNAH
jgi:D-alanyl-D-alanine carboxypeptidase/D-alanyl-D-alanine-endopeptidase (penicillin-binding protein 4)